MARMCAHSSSRLTRLEPPSKPPDEYLLVFSRQTSLFLQICNAVISIEDLVGSPLYLWPAIIPNSAERIQARARPRGSSTNDLISVPKSIHREPMPTLLVVSTSPGAGKTAFAATYAARLLADGAAVSLGKAFGAAEDVDVVALNTLVDGAKAIDPITVSGNPTDDQVKQAAQAAGGSDASAITVIEGLSGNHAVNRSLADELDASVVLVSGQSDFKSAIEAAPVYGDRLAGVVINNAPRHRGHDLDTEVVPALEVAGLPYIGVIPEDRRLVAVTARAINECLGGEWLEWEEHADELVENVLIGGLVLDWGPLYFASQENAAVLVRGDRPDLAIAALATPIKALILTCGVQPVEYVYYEADKRQVPLTVVKSDTQQAAMELERFLEFSHFDHPAKLERFSELASEHLDLDRIDAAIARPVTG